MTNVKVLGTGCANCKTTLKLIEEIAAEKGVAVELEKIEDMQAIMGYGVMSTPGVVVDGKVVHAGGVPSRDKVAGWLSGAATDAKPAGGGCCGGCC
jgi:small redox-active disulfide protein 2